MREECLPPLAQVEDERVQELIVMAEKVCTEAERLVAEVDPKFIIERKGKKNRKRTP